MGMGVWEILGARPAPWTRPRRPVGEAAIANTSVAFAGNSMSPSEASTKVDAVGSARFVDATDRCERSPIQAWAQDWRKHCSAISPRT